LIPYLKLGLKESKSQGITSSASFHSVDNLSETPNISVSAPIGVPSGTTAKETEELDDSLSLTEGFVSAEEEWDDETTKSMNSGTLKFGLELGLGLGLGKVRVTVGLGFNLGFGSVRFGSIRFG
jgi:hypothetical protein